MAGNSLGSIIMNYNLPEGHEEWSFQEANSYFFSKFYNDRPSAYESYETWLAWKAIMGVSEIMSTLYPDTPAPKEGIDWLNEGLVPAVEEISPLKDMNGVQSADRIWKPRRANRS
ncbi:hypothetical protein BSK49_16455 [Paenibacillus odorifer]|uniref:hypothetical protein n=1 Tax=Paenibacillus odorifer TaxID=189426 RepID=UPI00096F061E|nr:hypothetical protein [Paenibacillus odorifer]OMD88237.1 hypothetical protein BSK49_16455 [Paenibacillus odorifer]